MSKDFKLRKNSDDILLFDVKFDKDVKQNIKYGNFSKLDNVKSKIDIVDQDDWTKIRKISNVYEAPFYKASKKIISRAFYKLWEILYDYNISCNTETLHLCEAPGGFIQATLEYKRKNYNDVKTCHTVSLMSSSESSPNYHSTVVKRNDVNVMYDNDGDLYDINTILNICSKLKGINISLVTADGGITDNGDFNNKEILHTRLIFNQLFSSCCVLDNLGCLVLKIFDIFTDISAHILFLLNYLFEEVSISKPLTSRPTNSEKYVICKGFYKDKFSPSVKNTLYKCVISQGKDDLFLSSLLKIPQSFIDQIKIYNQRFLEHQISFIEKNLSLINEKKHRSLNIYNFVNQKKIHGKNWITKYHLSD